jgi:hypothetical protein
MRLKLVQTFFQKAVWSLIVHLEENFFYNITNFLTRLTKLSNYSLSATYVTNVTNTLLTLKEILT